MIGVSRSALIVKLFEQYLGQATYDYLDGYNSLAGHEKPIEIVISEDLDERLEASDLSDSAKQYLKMVFIVSLLRCNRCLKKNSQKP